MHTVSVGIIGAGFAAGLHAEGLKRVFGVTVKLVAVAAGSSERSTEFARRHGIPTAYTGYEELLADPAIDVVCVCVPNALHAEVVIAAVTAGKHVICEKPLTGAFGVSDPDAPAARGARAEAARARESMNAVSSAVDEAGVLFMYAENWVYAPAMSKTKSMLAHSRASILDIRAEESHSGSHAARTRNRQTAGGGALLTLGSHAIGAAIHLKAHEAELAGRPRPRVSAVTADISTFSSSSPRPEKSWLVEDWVDVERWANVVLRFDDDTRAVITASFAMLGGTRNMFEVYTTNSAFRANMTPSDGLLAFTPDAAAFGEEYLHEKVESRTGWISASPDEDWIRGYPQEMQDFMSSVAEGRQPTSGLDLARDVVDVVYSSYISAEEGRRVELTEPAEGERIPGVPDAPRQVPSHGPRS
jgi:predicted dehydrogenase